MRSQPSRAPVSEPANTCRDTCRALTRSEEADEDGNGPRPHETNSW